MWNFRTHGTVTGQGYLHWAPNVTGERQYKCVIYLTPLEYFCAFKAFHALIFARRKIVEHQAAV